MNLIISWALRTCSPWSQYQQGWCIFNLIRTIQVSIEAATCRGDECPIFSHRCNSSHCFCYALWSFSNNKNWKISSLNLLLWFSDHVSLGQAQPRHLLRSWHLWKFVSLIKRVQNSLLAFDVLFKEVRTEIKKMLFATGEFWAGYTPKVLSFLCKGIIQRTNRNPLFQWQFYETSITFKSLLFTVDMPAEAKAVVEARAMAADLWGNCGRGSCSSFLSSILLASWTIGH